jgi:voltage-gated potassium channel
VRNRSRVQRLAWWNRVSEPPLIAASVLFLAAFSGQVLGRLGADNHPAWDATANAVQDLVWALFCVDYAWRLALAKGRWHYFSRHLADLLIIALPVFRVLRLLRVLLLLRVLSRSAGATLRGRMAVYVGGTAALLLYCGSLAVLQAERGHPGANIQTFGQALWWSNVTMCTVGYGDYAPVTGTGRVVAAGLMVSGIAVIGLVTASFAAWLVGRVRDDVVTAEEHLAATRRDLSELAGQLDRIERRLDAIEAFPRLPL